MTENERVSETALTAAAARAAHLIVDGDPPIFSDTLAGRLLGERAGELVGYHRAHGSHPVLAGARAAVTVRSRYTEDRLARAVSHGTAQYVILGAGLDSFGYRSRLALGGRIRVLEVDHAATQRWKRRALTAAGITVPAPVTFIPADFEAGSVLDDLAGGGLDPSRPAFFSWLGVTMYLTREAIGETLAVVGALAPGTEIVVEYMLPAGMRDPAGQAYAEAVMPVAAARGEPWLTCLRPGEVSALLTRHGFEVLEQVRQRDAVDPALWNRDRPLRPSDLSMLARARLTRR